MEKRTSNKNVLQVIRLEPNSESFCREAVARYIIVRPQIHIQSRRDELQTSQQTLSFHYGSTKPTSIG